MIQRDLISLYLFDYFTFIFNLKRIKTFPQKSFLVHLTVFPYKSCLELISVDPDAYLFNL
jgi:hypothetical protein